MQKALAIGVVLATATAATAENRVTVEVTVEDKRFGKRAVESARLHYPGGSFSSDKAYFEQRLARKLGELLPMYTFTDSSSPPSNPPSDHRLVVTIGTFARNLQYPVAALKMRLVSEPSGDVVGDFELLPKCVQLPDTPPCGPEPKDLAANPWLEDALEKIVQKWDPLGAALYPFAFSAEVKNDNGWASVDGVTAKNLGWSRYTPVLFETRSASGEENRFLVCSGTRGRLGPFLDDHSPEQIRNLQCKPYRRKTDVTSWTTFRLLRYWPLVRP